jgi:hypothetical protein
VSDWAVTFLGVIAVATLVTAVVQVVVLVSTGLVVRRLGRLVDRIEQDLQPLFGQLHAIAREGARAASLGVAQVERADQLFADIVRRLDETLDGVQSVIAKPAREGAAILAGLKAALDTVRASARAHALAPRTTTPCLSSKSAFCLRSSRLQPP